MSETPDLVYYRDSEPWDVPAGVTSGHLVLWSGGPGDALIAPAALLMDDDGAMTLVQNGEARPCRVVEDEPRP